MESPGRKGALVLVSRSKRLDNFSWFKIKLLELLTAKYRENVAIVDISTRAELIGCLFSPPTLFDVAEVHVLVEFNDEKLRVGEDEAVGLGTLSNTVNSADSDLFSIAGAEYLTGTTVKIWYWTESGNPTYDLLIDFSRCFRLRFFFLPLAQLKLQFGNRKNELVKEPDLRVPTRKNKLSLVYKITMPRVAITIVVIVLIKNLLPDGSVDYAGHYDEVITYEDSSLTIDDITRGLDSDRGSETTHTWIFARKQWVFTWFIANQWLEESRQELRLAATKTSSSNNQFWASIYTDLMHRNENRLENVVNAIRHHGRRHQLDRYEMATFALAFVQHIPYKIPRNDLELLAPPQTVNEKYGDCDSKSLLYALILKRLGYDVSMFVSMRYRHAMAGVAINAAGSFKSHNGRRYYFADTTAAGHRIGQLASSQGRLGSWLLVPL